jgi:prophage regulatory protein
MSTTAEHQVRALRDKDVAAKISGSRAHVWNLVKNDPTFPRPARLSSNFTIWLESEVDAWLLSRVAAARQS